MMKMMGLLLLLVLALQATTSKAAPDYRLQSTAYAVTIRTPYERKVENCQTAFGSDATLFDFANAAGDFTEEEFNEALAGVFFKEPNAAFYVAYGGTDTPSPSEGTTEDYHYVIKTTPAKSPDDTIDSFGNARVESWPKQSQLLCSVPVKEYNPTKATYKSKEDSTSGTSKSSKSKWGLGKMIFLVGFVAVALFMRKQILNTGGMGSSMSMTARYYSVLDQKAGGNNPFDDPPGVSSVPLTEGCELSYNPAVQGLV